MRMLRSALVAAVLAVMVTTATPVAAAPILIDFEALTEGDTPGLLSGVTLSDAMVLTAGSGLNEIDFPPVSGVNVVFNLLTELRLDFVDAVSNVGGYFTYVGALTLSAFDSSNNLLGVANSLHDVNYAGSGNPAQELLQFTSTTAIAYVTIGSAIGPGTFVLDDLSFEVAEGGGGDPNPPVPEPATVSLVLLGAAVAAGRQKLRARRQARV
jgi:hypothetical protein